jgi:hypothetical protein
MIAQSEPNQSIFSLALEEGVLIVISAIDPTKKIDGTAPVLYLCSWRFVLWLHSRLIFMPILKSWKPLVFPKNWGGPHWQAKTLAGLIDNQLATKQDIELLRRDMKEMEMKLSGEINLIKWMMGFILAGIAALILKAFFA